MSRHAPEPAPAPLVHPLPVARLARDGETPVSLAPEADALERVRVFLGLESLTGLSFEGQVAASGEAGWMISGRLQAELAQACIVTLEPVAEVIDEAVTRLYLPEGQIVPEEDVTVGPEDDAPDPFTDTLDLGALVVETLALAIDPYPRAKGAALERHLFAAPGVKPMTDEEARPFAALAALKDKLTGEGSR
ncbi:MAG: DUF177 domain-containing protein [Pseudomonadota bacterium]